MQCTNPSSKMQSAGGAGKKGGGNNFGGPRPSVGRLALGKDCAGPSGIFNFALRYGATGFRPAALIVRHPPTRPAFSLLCYDFINFRGLPFECTYWLLSWSVSRKLNSARYSPGRFVLFLSSSRRILGRTRFVGLLGSLGTIFAIEWHEVTGAARYIHCNYAG